MVRIQVPQTWTQINRIVISYCRHALTLSYHTLVAVTVSHNGWELFQLTRVTGRKLVLGKQFVKLIGHQLITSTDVL